MIVPGDFLDALTVPLKDAKGNTFLHFVLREQRPDDFAVAQASDDRYYYSVDLTVNVLAEDGKPIFVRDRSVSQYFGKDKFDEIKQKTFAYEGMLPLTPGKYKLEFVLVDRLKHAGFRIEKMEYSEAVFVGNEGDQVAVIGERELVYVPGNVAGEIKVRL